MNLRRLAGPVVALALICAGLGGCASFSRHSDDVSVTLADIRPLGGTAFESRLALTVRVTNATPEALHFSGSRHRLVVNGRALGVAVASEAFEVDGLSTVTEEVTFNLSHLELIPLANELRRQPLAVYEIESTFFGAGVLSRGLSTRQTGRVDLSNLAGAPGAGG